MRYDAFISYSHLADSELAAEIQRGLERLATPWYRRKPFLRIIRDETAFAAGSDLGERVTGALDASDHLILLLSHNSAASPWVDAEIRHWLATKSKDDITIVVTDWGGPAGAPQPKSLSAAVAEPNLADFDWTGEDLPPSLRGIYSEPLVVDMRWAKTALASGAALSLADERFADDIADVAAHVKGVNKDELIGTLVAMRARARVLTGTVGLVIAILLVGAILTLIGLLGARRAEQSARERQESAEAAALDAEEAQRVAELAQAQAEEAAIAAEVAAQEARAAQVTAEEQQRVAELAQADAEQAATAAEVAAQEARAAQADAEAKQQAAELAQADAEEAAAAAEVAAQEARDAQAAAEEQQRLAELAQADAEEAAAAAEVAAEAARAAQADAEEQQEAAELAQAAAEEAAAAATALAEEAETQRFAASLESESLGSADDPALALNLAVAAFCETSVSPACSPGVNAFRAAAVDVPKSLQALSTLIDITQRSRGVEQHLTTDNVVAAATAERGSVVALAVRPAVGHDRLVTYEDGSPKGSVAFEQFAGPLELEVQALALSSDSSELAFVVASRGRSVGEQFVEGSTYLGWATVTDGSIDRGTELVRLGSEWRFTSFTLDFEPGSDRRVLLQAERSSVAGEAERRVHVLLDVRNPQLDEQGFNPLAETAVVGPAAFKEDGSLLLLDEQSGSGEGIDFVDAAVVDGDGGPLQLTITLSGKDPAGQFSLWERYDDGGGTGTTFLGHPVDMEVVQAVSELRVTTSEGRVFRWSLPGLSPLPTVDSPSATAPSEVEVVFGPTGAATRRYTGEPLGGWGVTGVGHAAASADGSLVVLGSSLHRDGEEPAALSGLCSSCAVATSRDATVIATADGVVTDRTGRTLLDVDVPEAFDRQVAVSSSGRYVAFGHEQVVSLPPTQNSELRLAEPATGQVHVWSDFAGELEQFPIGVSDEGWAVAAVDSGRIMLFAPARSEPTVLVDLGTERVVQLRAAGDRLWVLTQGGVVREVVVDAAAAQASSTTTRLSRTGFGTPTALDVVPGTDIVAIGLADGEAELWQAESAVRLAAGLGELGQPVEEVVVDVVDDGVNVTVIGDARNEFSTRAAVVIHRLNAGDLIRGACAAANRQLTEPEWTALGGEGEPGGC